jgi:membrane protease YdiL (CAAX protease family)
VRSHARRCAGPGAAHRLLRPGAAALRPPLATLAGIAYGLAFRRGGLLAAVWAYFLLNLAHILLFTYPLLLRR